MPKQHTTLPQSLSTNPIENMWLVKSLKMWKRKVYNKTDSKPALLKILLGKAKNLISVCIKSIKSQYNPKCMHRNIKNSYSIVLLQITIYL